MKKPENTTIEKNNKKEYAKVDYFEILRVKIFDNGNVVFDMKINDVAIYGCRVVESKNGDFIAFPQRKGADGKYYHIAYLYLRPEDSQAILHEVEVKLNGN